MNSLKLFALLLCISSAFGLTKLKRSIGGRIIGGEVADAGQFPWAAAIYLTTSDGNYFCGGALLSNDWVLTAGQCVDGVISFTIVLGTHLLEGDEQTRVRVATDIYFLHPAYNPETLDNDVGLIQFRSSIGYTDYIKQAHLPFQVLGSGYALSAIGWGQTTDAEAGLVNELNWVRLTSLSQEECRLFYGNQVTDSMLCVEGNYNEGTCLGDSGGPLTRYISRDYNVIDGVASFVPANGCESVYPSGYTRIYSYNDWINNVTSNLAPIPH